MFIQWEEFALVKSFERGNTLLWEMEKFFMFDGILAIREMENFSLENRRMYSQIG